MNHMNRWMFVAGALAVLVLTGCAQTQQASESRDDFFTPIDNTNAVKQMMNAQAASGAANDATLYAYHFTDGQLNSAGQAKLDRIVDHGTARTIYLDLEGDASAPGKAVSDYLATVASDEFRIETSHNPANTGSAGEGLEGLKRQRESVSTDSGGSGMMIGE